MRKIFRNLATVAVLAAGFTASAQQIPTLNHYIYNPYIINPAAAGAQEYGNVFLTHKRQWDGVPGAPVTSMLSYDAPLRGSKIGFGFSLLNDQVHILNRNMGSATFSYRIPFSKKTLHRLGFGISAIALGQNIDYNRVVGNQADPNLLRNGLTAFQFDASAGLLYQYKTFEFGFAVPQLLGSQLDYSSSNQRSTFSNTRHYIVHSSYHHTFGTSGIGVKPIVMARFINGFDSPQANVDGTVIIDWKKKFWVGAGYRYYSQDALNLTAGVKLADRITIAYSFEGGMGGSKGQYLGNSHEVTLNYYFGGRTRESDAIDSLTDATKKLQRNQRNLRDRVDQIDTIVTKLNEKDSISNAKMQTFEETISKANLNDAGDVKSILDRHDSEIKQLQKEVKTKAPKGKYRKLGSIYFEKNSSLLSEDGKKKMEVIKEMLNTRTDDVMIYIQGKASEEGSNQANMILSLQRAVTIKRFITGTSPTTADQVTIWPYGEENADILLQKSEEEKSKERRVDIFISEGE